MKKTIYTLLTAFVLMGACSLTAKSQTFTFGGGNGTLGNPYLIKNRAHMEELARFVKADKKYEQKYYKLENNIYLNDPWTGIGFGTEDNKVVDAGKFHGIFDGDGHTIEVNFKGPKGNNAIFHYTKDATIKNLKVAGTIFTTGKFAAGIANIATTTTLINCESAVKILSNVNDQTEEQSDLTFDGTHGGFIGVSYDNVSIEACVFSGSMASSDMNFKTSRCGGFVGWAANNLSISNSLNLGDFEKIGGQGSGIFFRTQNFNNCTVDNSYYLNKWGETGALRGTQLTDSHKGLALLGTFPENDKLYYRYQMDGYPVLKAFDSENWGNLKLDENSNLKGVQTTDNLDICIQRDFTKDMMCTLTLPFSITKNEADGLGTFYTLESFNEATGAVHLIEVKEDLKANTGYFFKPMKVMTQILFKGKQIADNKNMPDPSSTPATPKLVGTVWLTKAPQYAYGFSSGMNSNSSRGTFIQVQSTQVNLPAFGAYLWLPQTTQSARSLNVHVND